MTDLNEFKYEINEYLKCQRDFKYFCNNYFKVVNPVYGMIDFKLKSYQKTMIDTIDENDAVVFNVARQMGKTTLFAAYALWTALFKSNQNVLMLSNNNAGCKDMLDRVQLAYENLPDWLKCEQNVNNKRCKEFSNGSRIATVTSLRGWSANVVIFDEFAFSNKERQQEAIYYAPVHRSMPDSKLIIASTPNGTDNLFHKLATASPGFKTLTVKKSDDINYDPVKGAEHRAAMGELKYKQEFECEFIEPPKPKYLFSKEFTIKLRQFVRLFHGPEV